jgi:hypothetical protein
VAPTVAGWVVLSGSYNCAIVTTSYGASCIQDTAGDYGNSESCTFLYNGDATIYREEWAFETSSGTCYDWLKIEGNKKCGTSGSSQEAIAASFAVTGTTAFEFETDSSIGKTGFKLCNSIAVPTEAPKKALSAAPDLIPSPTDGVCADSLTWEDNTYHNDCEYYAAHTAYCNDEGTSVDPRSAYDACPVACSCSQGFAVTCLCP